MERIMLPPVFKMSGSGTLTLVAGNSRAGFSGDGGPAVKAQLNAPQGMALDKAGNLYIADSLNNRVRMVTSSGLISTFAGNGRLQVARMASTPEAIQDHASDTHLRVIRAKATDEGAHTGRHA